MTVLYHLSRDLSQAFPETKGFSITNLKSMRIFYRHYPSKEFGQALPAQLSWTHHVVIVRSIENDNLEQKKWYALKTIENGWGYRELKDQIKTNLYNRQANTSLKTTNCNDKLISPNSELANEIIKDPYKFHFLTVGNDFLWN